MLIDRSALVTYNKDTPDGEKQENNIAAGPTDGSDDKEADGDDKDQGAEGTKTDYLPLPRTKDNPFARGGAINIQPQAPNYRLDSTLQFE